MRHQTMYKYYYLFNLFFKFFYIFFKKNLNIAGSLIFQGFSDEKSF